MNGSHKSPQSTGWTSKLSKLLLLFPFGIMALIAPVHAEKAEPAEKPAQEEKPKEEKPQAEKSAAKEVDKAAVVQKAVVTIDGKKIPYQVTASKLVIQKDDEKAKASIFHVAYERTDIKDLSQRPVVFAFNGGPGSSAVWLHIGMLGPKILQLNGDGTTAPEPPVRLVDNPQSILDVCDLVFIDPVSTGYSRADKDTKADVFHGVNADIESVGEFIRRWVTEHKRWGSPKYLLGESYGGIRAAGLSHHLQSRYGMSLNGVVMLSTLMDFRTLGAAPGSDLAHSVYLPAYTSVAKFHGKIDGDLESLIKQSREFAFGDYALAMLQGNALSDTARAALAKRLAALTGISAELWIRYDLRIDPEVFRVELLRDQNKVLGRFDGRVAWSVLDESSSTAEYDPSYSLAYGAFSTAMLDYLSRDLGYQDDQHYEILTGKVNPWKWDSNNQELNVSNRLENAMRDNPKLRVLVMSGHADLATPADSMAYSLSHMHRLPATAQTSIKTVYYQAGHMFYLNPPDLSKARKDLIEFIR